MPPPHVRVDNLAELRADVARAVVARLEVQEVAPADLRLFLRLLGPPRRALRVRARRGLALTAPRVAAAAAVRVVPVGAGVGRDVAARRGDGVAQEGAEDGDGCGDEGHGDFHYAPDLEVAAIVCGEVRNARLAFMLLDVGTKWDVSTDKLTREVLVPQVVEFYCLDYAGAGSTRGKKM
ncbi:hypothetical protein PG990_008718 [Apiospora arundinis]